MQKQPLLLLLLCFIAGILLYERFPLEDYYVFTITFSAFVFLLFSFLNPFKRKLFTHIALAVSFFSAGIFTQFLKSDRPEVHDFKGKQNLLFKLDKKLNSNEKYRRYEVEILKIQNSDFHPFKAVISVPKTEIQLDFKNYYQTESYINRVAPPNNDFQFNYAKYLSRKGIYYQVFINEKLISQPKKSLTLSDKIHQRRVEILQNIDRSSLRPKNKEFLKGIILADRTEMDAETVSDFNKSGLVHLLAISGSHMVIIFWLLMLVLRKIIPVKFSELSVIFALVLIWLFAIFIDYGSSVMRSCIMITAYYIFVLLQRKSDLLHAMALAGFAILAVDSNQIFDVGFQLSFLAVAGIYWLNQPILRYLPKPRNDFQNFLVNIPSVSLSAQLATLPLVVYYFHQYSLVSIFANLVIIPFSEILIISSLIMTGLLAFNLNFGILLFVYDHMVSWLLASIKWFANMEFAFGKNIPMTLAEAFLLLFAFYFLRSILIRKKLSSAVNFSVVMLAFFLLRIGLNAYHFQTEEVLSTSYFKDKVLISKAGNEAVFYIKEKNKAEKIKKYIAEPYLTNRRINRYKIQVLKHEVNAVKIGANVYAVE